LIVSREDPEAASLIPGRGAGTAGLAGRGLGVGSCADCVGLGVGLAAARGVAPAGLRPWGGIRLAALAAGRAVTPARGCWPRDRAGSFEGRL